MNSEEITQTVTKAILSFTTTTFKPQLQQPSNLPTTTTENPEPPDTFPACDLEHYNHTTNYDDYNNDNLKNFILVIYIFIGIVAIGGNFLVIFLILLTKSLRTVTNTLICNMGLSNILLACISIPFSYKFRVKSVHWLAGDFACKIFTSGQVPPLMVMAFVLISLNCDRYRSVFHPHSRKPSITCVFLLCGAMWVVAGFFGIPLFVLSRTFARLTYEAHIQICTCMVIWPSVGSLRGYMISVQVIEYVIPIIVFGVIGYRLCSAIWCSSSSTLGEHESGLDTKKDSVKMVMVLSLTYILFWLTFNIVKLVEMYGIWNLSEESEMSITNATLAGNILGMCQLALNPVICFCMNYKFRDAFLNYFWFGAPGRGRGKDDHHLIHRGKHPHTYQSTSKE